ncbi:hypothetical protein CASFOL_038906 [Castilleja foliolosa]|uniref:YTH domain-containing family protein n=1 Tax=Castilleja foliolosa TaxID=1961234 RepID=A0ABD3BIS8_9LAMI
MYNEGVPEYFVEQGLYYPTATNYGYVTTGLESAGDWEDHRNTFRLDGQDIQYTGPMNENLPYVYYPPSPGYGYVHYPYNPYNSYIPGAMIGVKPIVAPQQYYDVSSYEHPVSLPAYAPVVILSRADSVANGISGPFDNRASVNRGDGLVAEHNMRPNAANSPMTSVGGASASEGGRANTGSGKQPRPSGGLLSQPPSQISQVRVPQGTKTGLPGKASANGLSGFESRNPATASVHKVKPKVPYRRVPESESVSHDTFSELNRGPRLNKSKNQWVVKAITKRTGNPDAQGNLTIFTDEFNKVDFSVDYQNAKFFVIKSYGEDDVHKSIKYNVWSSTPNGNRKLNAAYEDAQRISARDSTDCPIFLFFSVNSSGRFCGVAEMLGPVDFNRDMDFWQQDKWSGSFPVKWHIVKDLPNPHFRHIILENNENKPVTNSRDTQVISYRKGLKMLRIYKNHTLRTSLLDGFMLYENRQRIMQEERPRLLMKSYENPTIHDCYSNHGGVNGTTINNPTSLTIVDKNNVSADDELDGSARKQPLDTNTNDSMSVCVSSQVSDDGVTKAVDELKITSLTIHSSDEPESESVERSSTADVSKTAKTEPINFVTIGLMPVNVNANVASGVLTVGTIPLDPRLFSVISKSGF